MYFFSADELKETMATLGARISKAEIDDMIRTADIDGDGLVNFEGKCVHLFMLRPQQRLQYVGQTNACASPF